MTGSPEYEPCAHVCPACGGCPDCCPGLAAHQRDTWRHAIAQHKWRQRLDRPRRTPPEPGPGMIRYQPP